MIQLPRHIVERLKTYDRRLRLRWSREKRVFVLERKTNPRWLPRPVVYKRDGIGRVIEERAPEYSDRYIQFKDGFIEIMKLRRVDDRVLMALYESDTRRFGKRFIDEYERKEAEREELAARREADTLKDIAGESYDHLQYRQGERMFMGRT